MVPDLLRRAADHVVLETGLSPDAASLEAVFTDLPPGGRHEGAFRVRHGFVPLRVAAPARIGQRRHARLVMQRKLCLA